MFPSLHVLLLLALLGTVFAATSFTGLPSAVIAPGSQISGSYNTNGNFTVGDWFGLYFQNQASYRFLVLSGLLT